MRVGMDQSRTYDASQWQKHHWALEYSVAAVVATKEHCQADLTIT